MWNKKTFLLIISSLFILFFSSCSNSKQKARLYLGYNCDYLSLPQEETIQTIHNYENSFNPLDKSDFGKLSKLLVNEDDYIWIRIRFRIPENLKNKDLSLLIPFLHNADITYLNDTLIGNTGSFPPEEFGSGLKSHYYPLPASSLKQNEENTIYIKIWPGPEGSISDSLYIGERNETHFYSELLSYFNSKMYLFFAGIMVIVFFIYLFEFFILRKTESHPEYITYALLTLYTIQFLVPFFVQETPWVELGMMNYLLFLKIFFCCGIMFTVYFESSFIIYFLDSKPSKYEVLLKLLTSVIALIFVFIAPSYAALHKTIPILMIAIICQEFFACSVIIKSIRQKTNIKKLKQLLICAIPIFISIIIDFVLRAIIKQKNLTYFTVYGWQIFIFIFLSYLLSEFNGEHIKNISLNANLSQFNEKLEKEVSQRTQELVKTNILLAEQIKKTTEDLRTATLVQQGFLPPKNHVFEGWEISICYTPLSNVSGDFYDYYITDKSLDGVCLFDVSGHGTSAGLVTMLSKNIINQNFKMGRKVDESVSEILVDINSSIISAKSYTDRYLTGVLFSFSKPDEKDLIHGTLANAGHPYPLFYNHKTQTVSELKYHDPKQQYGIIGLNDFAVSFPNVDFDIEPDDFLVFFTDGITESTNKTGEQYGTEKLKQIITQNNHKSAKELMDTIMEDLHNYIGSENAKDDVTLIVLKRTPKDEINKPVE